MILRNQIYTLASVAWSDSVTESSKIYLLEMIQASGMIKLHSKISNHRETIFWLMIDDRTEEFAEGQNLHSIKNHRPVIICRSWFPESAKLDRGKGFFCLWVPSGWGGLDCSVLRDSWISIRYGMPQLQPERIHVRSSIYEPDSWSKSLLEEWGWKDHIFIWPFL